MQKPFYVHRSLCRLGAPQNARNLPREVPHVKKFAQRGPKTKKNCTKRAAHTHTHKHRSVLHREMLNLSPLNAIPSFWGPLDCLCFGPRGSQVRGGCGGGAKRGRKRKGPRRNACFLEEVLVAVSELRWHVARDVRQVWVSHGNSHDFLPRVPNPRNCHRENAIKHQS